MIEAAPEKMEIKQSVFRELDEATPGHAILASNTSSLSITEMADATLRPDKVVGFHFFYPASVMPLLEIVEGEETSTETVQAAINFAQAIRKQPITCAEVPGFVVNRILNSAVGEIWRAQEEQGPVDQEDRRQWSRRSSSRRWARSSSPTCSGSTRSSRRRAPEGVLRRQLLRPRGDEKLVAEGKLGAKSGGDGFYKDGEPQIEGDGDPDDELIEHLRAEGPRRGLPAPGGGRLRRRATSTSG